MHFISHEVEKKLPAALSFSDNWTAIWAAAEMSVKQLIGDIKQLESQINLMKTELKTGIPLIIREIGERGAG
jgi:hypothetical protein